MLSIWSCNILMAYLPCIQIIKVNEQEAEVYISLQIWRTIGFRVIIINQVYSISNIKWNLICTGDCCRGRNECFTCSERSFSCHRWISLCSTATLSTDPQHHRHWEELHHYFSATHGCPGSLYEKVKSSTDRFKTDITNMNVYVLCID